MFGMHGSLRMKTRGSVIVAQFSDACNMAMHEDTEDVANLYAFKD